MRDRGRFIQVEKRKEEEKPGATMMDGFSQENERRSVEDEK
jgi:hypothetical protein